MRCTVIIGIESTLTNIRQYLNSTGKFEVHLLGSYYGPIDAFIYENEKNNEIFTSYQENIRSIALENHIENNEGILMINAKHRTPREVEGILNTRLYSKVYI